MNQDHRTSHIRPIALLVSLLLAPALSAQAQQAKARGASAQSASAQSTSASADEAAPAASSGVVNINSASAEELTRLPGVGPSRAQAIIELRTRMNGFKSVEDLMRVRGIGRKSFRKLEPMLRLQGTTTLVEARAAARTAPATKR